MAYEIGQAQKIRKQNRNQLDNNTNTSSEPSTPSYRYGKLNENTDITSKKYLTPERHSRIIFAIYNKTSFIIQN